MSRIVITKDGSSYLFAFLDPPETGFAGLLGAASEEELKNTLRDRGGVTENIIARALAQLRENGQATVWSFPKVDLVGEPLSETIIRGRG